MKRRFCLMALAALILVTAGNVYSEVGDFYYNRHGEHIIVPLSDSLIFVRHHPAYPDVGGNPFISLAGILTDDYALLASAGDAYIYQLVEGHALADAITQLRLMPEAAIVNPVLAHLGDTLEFSYLTEEFIARFHDDVSQAAIDSVNNFYHVEVVAVDEDFPMQYLLRMTAETGTDALLISQAYFESGRCLYAEPNLIFWATPLGAPDDTYYGDQWNLHNTGQAGGIAGADIEAENAWEVTEGDNMPVVAVIDFGFELDHEDLEGTHFWWRYDAAGNILSMKQPDTDPSYWCNGPSAFCWHGTAMAGIISARLNNALGLAGLAPGCRLVPIKFCDNRGASNAWSVCEAFRHVRRFHPKVNVVSCSWRRSSYRPAIEAALDTTYNQGVFILFAAGNMGKVEYPAYSKWVTAVGATNNRDSVWDEGYFRRSAQGDSLDLVAPGVDLPALDLMGSAGRNPTLDTCNGDENYNCHLSGTSAACAEAAATAALVLSRRYDLADGRFYATPDTLRKVLFQSAEDQINPTDPEGWDPAYGHGRLNAYRALLSVIRGDVNNDDELGPLDVVIMVNYVYKNFGALEPERCVGDCTCDGAVNPVDVVVLVNHVYRGSARPGICFDYTLM